MWWSQGHFSDSAGQDVKMRRGTFLSAEKTGLPTRDNHDYKFHTIIMSEVHYSSKTIKHVQVIFQWSSWDDLCAILDHFHQNS